MSKLAKNSMWKILIYKKQKDLIGLSIQYECHLSG
jgi:hypothetical protein